ncbi:MAG: type I-E CRISPR-associated protein Cas6/Cse3/CasE [Stellaceae bacterium]
MTAAAGPVLACARLRRDLPAHCLARLLVPSEPGARFGAAHHLVWSLYADSPERRRDFLWREIRPGEFLILGARPPIDPHGLFDLDHKPFAPVLRPGQQLQFDLRANPVVSVAEIRGARGRRHDVVMHALKKAVPGDRAGSRAEAIGVAGSAWLMRKAAAAGFGFDREQLHIDRYERIRIPREGSSVITLSTLTFQGLLTVTEPARFVTAILSGFGSAKAYGCGLMLIRRAPT